MIYVALLRGINVGGKNKVEMARLKALFEKQGLNHVKTYINSGNVIFQTDEKDEQLLTQRLEAAIEIEFGFPVNVLIRNVGEIAQLVDDLPPRWVTDQTMRCDVMFLWPELDSPKILAQIPHNPEIEDVIYLPGAVIWRIDRANVTRGKVLKIIGTGVYQNLTIRNSNTVRKLYELMQAD